MASFQLKKKSNYLRLPASFIKNTISGFPLFWGTAYVLEVGTFTFMLEAHLRCPLCGVCWHFFDILIHTEMKLLPVAGLVAIGIVFEGSRRPEYQQLEVRIVRDHSLLLPLKIRLTANRRAQIDNGDPGLSFGYLTIPLASIVIEIIAICCENSPILRKFDRC